MAPPRCVLVSADRDAPTPPSALALTTPTPLRPSLGQLAVLYRCGLADHHPGRHYQLTSQRDGGLGLFDHPHGHRRQWHLQQLGSDFGTLPLWASLTSSSGAITGTPTAAATTSGLVFTVTDSAGNTASSGSLSLTVNAATTMTSLSLNSSSVAYGNESSVVFTATVSPGSPTAPTGTIAVKTGSSALCSITLPATTCSLPNTGVGNTTLTGSSTPYGVTATYTSGNGNFSGSTSGSQNLSVNKAATTTAVSFTSSSTYGSEASESFSVQVTGVSGERHRRERPASTMARACYAPQEVSPPPRTPDRARAQLSATQLSAGTYSTANSNAIVATYNSDPNYLTSSSSAQTLTVEPGLHHHNDLGVPNSVTYGDEEASTFTMTVTTGHGEVLPVSENETVTVGSTTCTASVVPGGSGGSGTCEIGGTALPATLLATTSRRPTAVTRTSRLRPARTACRRQRSMPRRAKARPSRLRFAL